MLADIHFVKYYKHDLLGRQFILGAATSNGSITWLNNSKNWMKKNCHGLKQLRPYNLIFIHRAKKQHADAIKITKREIKRANA